MEEGDVMRFVRGDSCYILNWKNRVEFAKVVGRKGTQFLLQRVGACGAIMRDEEEMFRSPEEAMENTRRIPPKIKVQLSEQ